MAKTFKKSPFLFQNFIRFSLVAFVACIAGIFFQENASAQELDAPNGGSWGQGWGSASLQLCTYHPGADSYTLTITQPSDSEIQLSDGKGEILSNNIQVSTQLPSSSSIALKPGDLWHLNHTPTIGETLASSTLANSSGSLWQNQNQLGVGNFDNIETFNFYSGATSIGPGGTINLAGRTMNVSAIELADGSKIVNGTIVFDNRFVDAKKIKQELQLLGVFPDQNKIFDLAGGTCSFSALKLENGGKIINGTIIINANNPADQVIREILASANN